MSGNPGQRPPRSLPRNHARLECIVVLDGLLDVLACSHQGHPTSERVDAFALAKRHLAAKAYGFVKGMALSLIIRAMYTWSSTTYRCWNAGAEASRQAGGRGRGPVAPRSSRLIHNLLQAQSVRCWRGTGRLNVDMALGRLLKLAE